MNSPEISFARKVASYIAVQLMLRSNESILQQIRSTPKEELYSDTDSVIIDFKQKNPELYKDLELLFIRRKLQSPTNRKFKQKNWMDFK